MVKFFFIVLVSFLMACKVFAIDYICEPWTNTLTLEKEEATFTAKIENGTLNLRSSNSLPQDIPKFSQLSITCLLYTSDAADE